MICLNRETPQIKNEEKEQGKKYSALEWFQNWDSDEGIGKPVTCKKVELDLTNGHLSKCEVFYKGCRG